MSLSPDLFLAILAMDSYNRGYDSGIGDGPDGLGESGSIGNANILARPNEIDIADWQAAGFYAVAYQWNGETVISYRGTDVLWHELPFVDLPIWSGDYDEPQLELAAKFYQSVANPANGAPPSGAIELTGHSLGGGAAFH
ncbi:hypothetical protein [uncultured Hoeflea sp.]|uniref:hypothetical protein n=1 Tax=uncultured Hoeflea sp. TaxID=538666 RepID=UPI00261201BA|nr:hypothetical protein [uncultured Hoeflea sp.]